MEGSKNKAAKPMKPTARHYASGAPAAPILLIIDAQVREHRMIVDERP
jgi:hypothetical protein